MSLIVAEATSINNNVVLDWEHYFNTREANIRMSSVGNILRQGGLGLETSF